MERQTQGSNTDLTRFPGDLSAIGIVRGPNTDLTVHISAGVERIYDDDDGSPAWTARGPWRPLDPALLSPHGEMSDDWATHLAVVALPPDLVVRAHLDLIQPLAQSNGQDNAALAAAIRAFRAALLGALADRAFALDDSGPADMLVNQPDRRSTAYDYGRHRLIGLHVDNHQALGYDARERSFILANLNIGWTERYLHFVPRRLAALLPLVGGRPHDTVAPRDIKNALFATMSETPVVRVTLPPGTAYLLNTQNCIHDGATPSGDRPDVAFLTMGNPR